MREVKKTMIKKNIITFPMVFFCMILSLIIGFSGLFYEKPMFHGDYPYYPEVSNITEAADIIIVGEVIKSKEVKNLMIDKTPNKKDKETTPYTISTVQVKEVVKGNVNIGDILEIKQLGDYDNHPEAFLYENDGYLSKHQEQLIFLVEYDQSPYSAVNPTQGMIEVFEDGSLYSRSKFSLFGYIDQASKSGPVDTIDSAIEEIRKFVN